MDVLVIGKKKAKVLSKEYWKESLQLFLQSNKFFEKTLRQIFQEIAEKVYSDTKDELEDDFENKISQLNEEIEKLENDLGGRKKVEDLESKIPATKGSASKEEETICCFQSQ